MSGPMDQNKFVYFVDIVSPMDKLKTKIVSRMFSQLSI